MASVAVGDQERSEAGLGPVRVPSVERAAQGAIHGLRKRVRAGPLPASVAGAHAGRGLHHDQRLYTMALERTALPAGLLLPQRRDLYLLRGRQGASLPMCRRIYWAAL